MIALGRPTNVEYCHVRAVVVWEVRGRDSVHMDRHHRVRGSSPSCSDHHCNE